MTFQDHPLWDFTVESHRRPGVHEACLRLQMDHRIDVNFLFWCCWVARTGAPPLDEKQLQTALDAVGSWQEEIVRPIWKARWKLKPAYGSFPKDLTEALRRQLIAAEINGEHIEMLHLAHAVKIQADASVSSRDRVSHAVENLRRYLTRHFLVESEVKQFPKSILSPLNTIVCACFPELEKNQIVDNLKERLI